MALASFPGSGNTRVRGLLEKATGVCTGEQIIIVQDWIILLRIGVCS